MITVKMLSTSIPPVNSSKSPKIATSTMITTKP